MRELAGLDVLDHRRMQHRARRRNEERRGHLLAIEHAEDSRQAVDRAVLAARQDFVIEVAGRQRRGGVVDVERQAHRDAGAVGPRAFQTLAGADVKHLRLQLIDGQLGAWERIGPRLLGGGRRRRRCLRARRDGEAENDREDAWNHPRSLLKEPQAVNVTALSVTWALNCCSGRLAGPITTEPDVENADPWHGQTKVDIDDPVTVQPSCVQVAVRTEAVAGAGTRDQEAAERRLRHRHAPGRCEWRGRPNRDRDHAATHRRRDLRQRRGVRRW